MLDMDSNFISAPTNFKHMEGNSVDFAKTFDLNGTDNDEMLRLYLRKAGLSDEIECLAPEQRRAFIYDIIKSNKLPGYWVPSTMKTTSFMLSPPVVRPPPPPLRTETSSVMTEAPTPTLNYATMSTSSSSNSLKSLGTNSPIMPHRFTQSTKTPPSPTTFVTNKKGMKYEISGPVNFSHISGDMTRDMTRNAFDLSSTMNDNVLKKYLIERGIKEEDICGMRKQDLIRKIVQSKYTWMPSKSRQSIAQVKRINRAIDDKEAEPLMLNQYTSSPEPLLKPPQNADPFKDYSLVNGRFSESSSISSTPSPIQAKDPFSNYAMINSRFADSSQFPAPNTLISHEPNLNTIVLSPLPTQAIRPAPPPRNSKSISKKIQAPPPPPSTIKADVNIAPNVYHSNLGFESKKESKTVEDLYAATTKKVKPSSNPDPDNTAPSPPPGPPSQMLNAAVAGFTTTPQPPPPPPPPVPGSTTIPLPPSMAPISQSNKNITSSLGKHTTDEGDSRDALLDSIRNGIALKKVDKKAATISGIKPRAQRKPPTMDFRSEPPPNQMLNTAVPGPTILLPPPMAPTNTAVPGSTIPLPPPMAPITQSNKNVTSSLGKNTNVGGDSRDALLDSIRNGIALKKVDKKAATISGIKPRAQLKPPTIDFMSELRMGITLRRGKNPAENPFSENDADESNA